MARFTSIALISSLALMSIAHAGPVPQAPQIVVHFADLDLTRAEGATVLYQRLEAAAEVVCGREDRDIERSVQFKKCVQRAIANAVANVGRPAVTTYYRARTTPEPQGQSSQSGN